MARHAVTIVGVGRLGKEQAREGWVGRERQAHTRGLANGSEQHAGAGDERDATARVTGASTALLDEHKIPANGPGRAPLIETRAGGALPRPAPRPGGPYPHSRRGGRQGHPVGVYAAQSLPKLTFEEIKGFTLYASRTILSGRADEIVELAKANLRDLGVE
jgi:hypothetical protein